MSVNHVIRHQLTYGSVCSGIEAASVAWEELGLRPCWFAEIEKFPSEVLAHHWPDTPNLGDMTVIADRISLGEISAPDVLVGGTPCQAFSLAGLRHGLQDKRGQLTLSYVELANAIDAKRRECGEKESIIVWENVPGVLSSADNAFGCFLAGLAGENEPFEPGQRPEHGKSSAFWNWNKKTGQHVPKWTKCGWVNGRQRKVAWRILDAQYFGVAQRRRRVFVIASARTDIDPTKILFEFDGLRRDIAPSRSAEKAASALTSNGVGVRGADDNQAQAGHLIAMAHGQGGAEIKTDDSAPTLTCNHEAPIVIKPLPEGHADFAPGINAPHTKSDAGTDVLAVHGTQDPDTLINVAHTLGRNQGQENAVIAFNSKDYGADATDNLSPTLRAGNSVDSNQNAGAPPAVAYSCVDSQTSYHHGQEHTVIAFQPGNCTRAAGAAPSEEVFPTLKSDHGRGMSDQFPHVAYSLQHEQIDRSTPDAATTANMTVRRLTPVECERLQGFPDNHTLIPVDKRKKITAEEYAYLRHHNPEMTAEKAYKLAADGPRYKAIGNSMAVPVMRWLMTRILSELPVNAPLQSPSPVPKTVEKMTKKKRKTSKAVNTSSFVRPFLKWPGGKYAQLDQIMPFIGSGKRLIEPFVGAGSVFLNAQGFERYIGGDTSADLIGLYHALQQNPAGLVDKARAMFEGFNTRAGYTDVREKFNRMHYTPLERAAAFLYLNRHAFNGLMRYNLKGGFNSSYGKYKAPYFPVDEMEAFSKLSPSCEFHCQSFVDTIRQAGEGDVLFCDPPYMPLPGKEGFTTYTGTTFTDEHQWQLLNEMVAAHQRGARVIATNSSNEKLVEAYRKAGFNVRDLFARRSMSCKGDSREIAVDIIATLGAA